MPIRLISTIFSERVQRERAVLAQRLDRVAGACAVHLDAERAELFGGVQRGGHRGFVGDVGLGEHGAVTEFVDGLLTPEVENDHLRARVEQAFRGGQSQPGGTTGDDGYGVFDLH